MDCSNFKNFVVERERMCREFNKRCEKCELYKIAYGRYCIHRCYANPEKAIAIVQDWSDKNPIMTRKKKFLEMFPGANMEDGGYPSACAGDVFGFMCSKTTQSKLNCAQCWAEPLEGSQ